MPEVVIGVANQWHRRMGGISNCNEETLNIDKSRFSLPDES